MHPPGSARKAPNFVGKVAPDALRPYEPPGIPVKKREHFLANRTISLLFSVLLEEIKTAPGEEPGSRWIVIPATEVLKNCTSLMMSLVTCLENFR